MKPNEPMIQGSLTQSVELKHLESNPRAKTHKWTELPSIVGKRVEDDSIWDLLTNFSDVIRQNPKLKLDDSLRLQLLHSQFVYSDELDASEIKREESKEPRVKQFRNWLETFVKSVKDTEAKYRESQRLLEATLLKYDELKENKNQIVGLNSSKLQDVIAELNKSEEILEIYEAEEFSKTVEEIEGEREELKKSSLRAKYASIGAGIIGGIAGIMVPTLGFGLLMGGVIGAGGVGTAAGIGQAYYRSEQSVNELEQLGEFFKLVKDSVHEKWELLEALKGRIQLIQRKVKRIEEEGEDEKEIVEWLKKNSKITGSSLMSYDWSF